MVRLFQRSLLPLLVLSLLGIALLSTESTTEAQRTCESVVANAKRQAAQNCGDIENGQACYAYNNIKSTYYEAFEEDPLAEPGSSIDFPLLHSMKSSALDVDTQEWGIGYIQLQVEDQETSQDQAVHIVVTGDVMLEVPAESVSVTTTADADLRAEPSSDSEVVDTVTVGETIDVNLFSEDGQWLRVILEDDHLAWIEVSAIEFVAKLDTLAGTGGVDLKLYYTIGNSGRRNTACNDAQNIVTIQSPEGSKLDLVVNDVPITIGSTVVFGMGEIDGEEVMFIAVIDGNATLFPDSPDQIEIEENEVATTVLSLATMVVDPITGEPIRDENGNPIIRRVPARNFSQAIPLSDEGDDFFSLTFYETLETFPQEFLDYVIELIQPEATPTATATTEVPDTGGAFEATLLTCDYNGTEYVETWSLANIPANASSVVFYGDVNRTVSVNNSVTVFQTVPTSYVYAVVNGEGVNAEEIFAAECPPLPTPTYTPTPVPPQPTNTPTATVVPVVADFNVAVNGLDASFTDQSTNAVAWSWQFGDSGTSSAKNPTHSYCCGGTYNVTLTVKSAAGLTDSITKAVTIVEPPTAGFTFVANGLTVSFTDTSTGDPADSYLWDFGDGVPLRGTSTDPNPVYTYASGGTYTVTLTVRNASGTSTSSQSVTVIEPPVANFTYRASGFTISFVDASTGIIDSYAWDFGEGGSATAASPTYTYATQGTYTVTLTVTNGGGSSTASQTLTVVPSPPVAQFSCTAVALDMTCTNTTTGIVDTYTWDFGDNATSNAVNPSYSYATQGTYTITLTATNAGGSTTATQNLFVEPPPVAGFISAQVDFSTVIDLTDTTTGGTPVNWEWDFDGDGIVDSTQQNPTYDFGNYGDFNVTLTVRTITGLIDSITLVVPVPG